MVIVIIMCQYFNNIIKQKICSTTEINVIYNKEIVWLQLAKK